MSSSATTQDSETTSSLGVTTEAEHLEELLDEALNETFPASDPVAITIEPRDAGKPVLPNNITDSTDTNASSVPQQ
jgi:hypothetical protein